MKVQNIAKLLLLPLILAIMIGMVQAQNNTVITSINVVNISSNIIVGNGTGQVFFNATSVGNGTGVSSNSSLYNITYQMKSTDTANSSWCTVVTRVSTNLTEDDPAGQSAAYNTSVVFSREGMGGVYLEDAPNYQIRVTMVQSDNGTNTATDATPNTGITIDHYVPTTPTSIQPATETKYQDDSTTMRINTTITGAKTTKCALTWSGEKTPTGNRNENMTHSGDTCYITLIHVPDGQYEFYITASDGTNSSTSATSIVNFDNKEASPTAKAYILAEEGMPVDGGFRSVNPLTVIALVLIVGYVILNRNKD